VISGSQAAGGSSYSTSYAASTPVVSYVPTMSYEYSLPSLAPYYSAGSLGSHVQPNFTADVLETRHDSAAKGSHHSPSGQVEADQLRRAKKGNRKSGGKRESKKHGSKGHSHARGRTDRKDGGMDSTDKVSQWLYTTSEDED
jgi:hypothetical protein